jgi:hypothetical protein
MWVSFGVRGYAKASDYAQNEYVDYLSDEIKEINAKKAAEMKAENKTDKIKGEQNND